MRIFRQSSGKAARSITSSACTATLIVGHVVCASVAHAQDAPAASPAAPAPSAEDAAAEAQRFDINEFVVRGNTALPQDDVERAVYPLMGPQRTLADARAARDALVKLYQDRGFQSVVVELPPQRVVGGVIVLQVTEATIGRVKVVGAQYHSPVAVRDAVPSLAEGKVPNFTAAQEQLTRLNRDPKRQVVPLLRPGTIPGTLDVDLKVDDRSPRRASLGLNNDYSADTEELRAIASVGYDNLWQLGHSLSLTFFTAPQDTDQVKVWSGSYLAPLPGSDWSLQLAGYTSDSNVATLGSTTVLGKGTTFGVSGIYRIPSGGGWANSLSIGIEYKDFEQSRRFGGEEDKAPIRYVPVTVAWNGYRGSENSSDSIGVTVSGSTRGSGSDDRAFDDQRFKANASFLTLKANWEHTQKVGDWQWLGRLGTQMATSPLISSEQYALGGAYSVRGYLSAESTGDYGYVGTFEWQTPSIANAIGPWVDDWRFYAFVDGGVVFLKDPLPEQEDEFDLFSVGIGTRWQFAKNFSGNLDVALPLTEGPNTDNASSSTRVLFNVRAGF